MSVKEAWAIRPTDTYYAVYGALGDSADEDIEDWCRDAMMVAHVDACGRWNNDGTPLDKWTPKTCGHGWYCDGYRKIEEL